MNISSTNVQQTLHRVVDSVQKHSPAILTTVGAASVLTAGVFAAKNTLRLEAKIDEGQNRLIAINDRIEQGDIQEAARTAVYVRNVLEIVRLYLLPFTLMVGGILCMVTSNRILTKRNAALVAAYNGLAASYEAYRERVREEYGEDKEREIFYGEKTVVEEVDGKKVKKKILADGEHTANPYRFVYDMHNPNWSGFHEDNIFRLTVAQNMYNDILKTGRKVFLRDVLITLGIEPTEASEVTGWVYKPNDANHRGDNFVEFNIRDYQSEYGYILLDFNVDGNVIGQ